MSTIQLDIVSPDKLVYSDEIDMLICRTTGGELGILPKHTCLATGLLSSAIRIKKDGTESLIAVAGGFMEVTPDKITILASAAETPIEIDINRAQRAYARAKKRLGDFKASEAAASEIDAVRAENALRRAMARLQATKTKYE